VANRSPTNIGHIAEEFVANRLKEQRFEIITRNWRDRLCEIDIVALDQDRRLRIIEVRYRKNDLHGGVLESITPDKVSRLRQAARIWISQYHSQGNGYQIDFAGVSGFPKPSKLIYLPNVIQIG
jgi:putative endonuclease